MTIISLYLLFAMLAVLWFDLTRYRIPNWLTVSLLLVYPLAVWMAPGPVEWRAALLGCGIVLAVGYGVFSLRWMGGGDVKLITACSLWTGLHNLAGFIFLFAVIGGAFSLLLWGARKLPPHLPALSGRSLPRLLRPGQPVPYGFAIAAAFLLLMWMGQIPVIAAP